MLNVNQHKREMNQAFKPKTTTQYFQKLLEEHTIHDIQRAYDIFCYVDAYSVDLIMLAQSGNEDAFQDLINTANIRGILYKIVNEMYDKYQNHISFGEIENFAIEYISNRLIYFQIDHSKECNLKLFSDFTMRYFKQKMNQKLKSYAKQEKDYRKKNLSIKATQVKKLVKVKSLVYKPYSNMETDNPLLQKLEEHLEERYFILVELLDAGYSQEECSLMFDVSTSCISNWMKKIRDTVKELGY